MIKFVRLVKLVFGKTVSPLSIDSSVQPVHSLTKNNLVDKEVENREFMCTAVQASNSRLISSLFSRLGEDEAKDSYPADLHCLWPNFENNS